MADDSRILELVEQALASNLTPEEVCAHCPELIADVRAYLNECRDLDSVIEGLFPSTPVPRVRSPKLTQGAPLPDIPGYEVLGVLGHGGIGVIYRARHLRLNRVVALKMLLSGEFASRAELARFRREAEAVATLQHPNIVQIHDVGDVDGRPYFTMEFVAGGTLAQKLSGIPQPGQYSASLTQTLALAIHAAHLAGIVHRDLKPGNILLTLDGTPKISDFGLARGFEGPTDVTLGPAKVGTPSYMAPEQVVGKPDSIGPAADIYGLGAILYELLTGRPPFRGETATDTERQLLAQDPVRPSRLNGKVPRDLETICLKCLQKVPTRRYASAAALAVDLRRFQEGRPIQARPVGRVERAWRWGRRNPSMAALLLTALALVGLASGGGTWLVQQRNKHNAELRTDISTAVTEATSLRAAFRFNEARALLEEARQRLEPAGPENLRRQVHQARDDLELVENLDKARLLAASPVEGRLGIAGAESPYADSLYEQTFAKAGMGGPGDDIAAAAARVRSSARRDEIVGALEDWASITADPTRRAWLLAVARGADPDTIRDSLRQPALWADGPGLTKLVKEVSADKLSPQLTSALARVLLNTGGDPVPLLSASQVRDPQDFWLNFELGWALFVSRRSDEALGFYRAALALRPQASAPYNGLGLTLGALGRWDEAIVQYRQGLRIDPNFAMLHNNFGLALWSKGQQEEANSQFQDSMRLDPKASSSAHGNLGLLLWGRERQDEAISHYQESIRLNPKGSAAHYNLGRALSDRGRRDEAISHFQESIRLDPRGSARAHAELGLTLWHMGRLDEAIGHYEESIRLDPKVSATVHFELALALRDKGRLDEAIDHVRQTIELEPTSTVAPPFLAAALLQAARADLATAAGQGPTTSPFSESERADKRQQALARLRAIMELRAERLNERKAVEWSVAAWQTDPALASVREPAALGKLPEAERADWQRLWTDVAAVVRGDPVEQREENVAHRKWAQAADGYARALKRAPTDDGHFWYEYAALSELSGDRSGYKNACAHMIGAFGKNGGPRAYHVARACTLAPDAVADISVPTHLAQDELRVNAGNAGQFWSLTEQGALAYRAGRVEESLPLFEKSLQANTKPGAAVVNWLWLALANQRLGKTDDARRWLEKAQRWLDQFRDGLPPRADQDLGLHVHNWLEANVLRREAEAMIAQAPSTVPTR